MTTDNDGYRHHRFLSFVLAFSVLLVGAFILVFIMVVRKDQLESQLKDEHELIRDGVLKDDSPLDVSEEFRKLCEACRRGDLKGCQEMIATGVQINARDQFDYTPLILVSSAA